MTKMFSQPLMGLAKLYVDFLERGWYDMLLGKAN